MKSWFELFAIEQINTFICGGAYVIAIIFFYKSHLFKSYNFYMPFKVSVHISESSDEEADEEFLQVELRTSDVESGSSIREKQRDRNKPHVDEIVPIFRRDCHEEVQIIFISYN